MLQGDKLFKKKLLILIRDLERNSMDNSLNEFKNKINEFLLSRN